MRTFCVIIVFICAKECIDDVRSCGTDNSPSETVGEGTANIEWYPWMGLLVYPIASNTYRNEGIKLLHIFGFQIDARDDKPQTTTVVLITRQLALATALEVDKFSKTDFREKSRVIFGYNCSSAPLLHVLEYIFHPDYKQNYYSALAMIQIKETVQQELMPLCSPPKSFEEPDIYAMTLKHDCKSGVVQVYKMAYVDLNQCKDYYRRNDLHVQSLWPKHVSCAKSLSGGNCLWRSGTVLVTKQSGRWRLLGIGVYGPGCEAPARFLDYGKYHHWVLRSIARAGRVAITRIAPDYLILRRSTHLIQRYGRCDLEEVREEIYSEITHYNPKPEDKNGTAGKAHYNLTLISRSDYSCIVLRLLHGNMDSKASLKLYRWCQTPYAMCGSANNLAIFFHVEITFERELEYHVRVYGREFRYIDAKKMLYYFNQKKKHPFVKYAYPPIYFLSRKSIQSSKEGEN